MPCSCVLPGVQKRCRENEGVREREEDGKEGERDAQLLIWGRDVEHASSQQETLPPATVMPLTSESIIVYVR